MADDADCDEAAQNGKYHVKRDQRTRKPKRLVRNSFLFQLTLVGEVRHMLSILCQGRLNLLADGYGRGQLGQHGLSVSRAAKRKHLLHLRFSGLPAFKYAQQFASLLGIDGPGFELRIEVGKVTRRFAAARVAMLRGLQKIRARCGLFPLLIKRKLLGHLSALRGGRS